MAGEGKVKIWQKSGLGYAALERRRSFVGRFSRTRQLSRALTRPSSRDWVLGHKVLSHGWEWGLESLPLALPHKRHHLGVHRAGAQGVKSARILQRLEPGREGGRGKRRG